MYDLNTTKRINRWGYNERYKKQFHTNEEEIADLVPDGATKEQFKKDFESLNCYYLEINDEVHYINLEADKLQIGGATNCGFFSEFDIDIDYDFSFDENLQALIEEFTEAN